MRKLLVSITFIFLCSGITLVYLVPERRLSQEGSPYNITTHNRDKKKILIVSCKAGGGHISASDALTEYLEPEFCIGKVFIFSNILQSIDLLSKFSNKKITFNESYNFFLKRNWHRFTNFITGIGPWYFALRKRAMFKDLDNYIIKHRPDLIISVAPIINNELLEVAQKNDIPFLLIPLDLDATFFIQNIYKPTYKKFHVALSYRDSEIAKIINKAKIPETQISYVGSPIKKAFFEPHGKQSIRNDFNIPKDRPVILLMMGSQGSQELYEIGKQLSKLTMPAHLILVLGKSQHLKKSIHSLWFPKHISHTILGFTDRIPDLMSISDLLITKSGSVTVNEAIYSNLPMLLDGTSTVLKWEALNHKLIERYGLGKSIKRSYQIPHAVTSILADKENREQIKQNFASFEKKNPEQEIKLLVKQILSN